MKKKLATLLLLFPLTVFSQFDNTEFYFISKFGFGMGMSQNTYSSTLSGTSLDTPKTIKVSLGSGYVPEVGLGFKISRGFYFESTVSYVINQDFYESPVGNDIQTIGYSFNRLGFGFNGKYYVEVNETFLLDFSAGITYRVPKDLEVRVSGTREYVKYGGSLGGQLAFGGNYVFNKVVLNAGIRYRYESYYLKSKQELPDNFLALNSQLEEINSNGIDVVFSVLYLF